MDSGLPSLRESEVDRIPASISQSSELSAAITHQDAKKDQKPAANSPSQVPAHANATEIGNNSSESSNLDVLAEPDTPIHKRPLAVVVEDEAVQHSSTKRTPQSVNKPKKVFIKKEKKN